MTDYAIIDGVRTARPEKQSIRPRAFKNRPWPLGIIAFDEPTDRYVLWLIANYPYIFNVFYDSDFMNWMKPNTNGDLTNYPLNKYGVVVNSLKNRHLIEYGDKQRLTLKITAKGQIYRIYTHSTFNFWVLTLGVLLAALAIFKDDIFKRANKSDNKTIQKIQQTDPTVQGDTSQTRHKLNSDSSLIQTHIDTTKT